MSRMEQGNTSNGSVPCPEGTTRYGDLVLGKDGDCTFTIRTWDTVAHLMIAFHVLTLVAQTRFFLRVWSRYKLYRKVVHGVAFFFLSTLAETARWALTLSDDLGQRQRVGQSVECTIFRTLGVLCFWIGVWHILLIFKEFLLKQKGVSIQEDALKVGSYKEEVAQKSMWHLWFASIALQSVLNLLVLIGKDFAMQIRVWILISQEAVVVVVSTIVFVLFLNMTIELQSAVEREKEFMASGKNLATTPSSSSSFKGFSSPTAQKEPKLQSQKSELKRLLFAFKALSASIVIIICSVMAFPLAVYFSLGLDVLMNAYHVTTSCAACSVSLIYSIMFIPGHNKVAPSSRFKLPIFKFRTASGTGSTNF